MGAVGETKRCMGIQPVLVSLLTFPGERYTCGSRETYDEVPGNAPLFKCKNNSTETCLGEQVHEAHKFGIKKMYSSGSKDIVTLAV